MARAKTVLRDCEAGLRRLLEEAAGEGDYDAVETLAALARQAAGMAASVETSDSGADAVPSQPARAASAARGAAGGRTDKSSAKSGKYPRFVRQRDQLIKIGWSKKEKKEYQHKAPKHAVEAVANAVAKIGGDGRLFQAADLMPVSDPADDAEVPVYQVYLTLAWLRDLGLVDQHGRQGHSAAKPGRLHETIEHEWNVLSDV